MKKLLVFVFSLSLFSVFGQDVKFAPNQSNSSILRDSYRDSVIMEFEILVNKYRKGFGNEPIKNRKDWNERCNNWSAWQSQNSTITHDRPDSIFYDQERYQATWIDGTIGENCTVLFPSNMYSSPHRMAECIFTAWRDSPKGHRANLQVGSAKTYGLGFGVDVAGFIYVTYQPSLLNVNE